MIFYIYIPYNLPFVPFLFPLILLYHCLSSIRLSNRTRRNAKTQ